MTNSPTAPIPRLQLGFDDTAVALGLAVSTLQQIHRSGRGPQFFKVGRRLFTTEALIHNWQADQIEAIPAT